MIESRPDLPMQLDANASPGRAGGIGETTGHAIGHTSFLGANFGRSRSWEVRALGVASPGSCKPWELRALGVASPGNYETCRVRDLRLPRLL